MPCQSDSECPTGYCVDFGMSTGQRYCVEECFLSNTPSKCHGRRELACAPVPNSQRYACLPNCNTDAECATGLFCNPRTGLCSTTPITGSNSLTTCQSSASCRGICFAPPGKQGACFQRCTIGAQLNCILENQQVCANLTEPLAGTGDLGVCVRPCTCPTGCYPIGACGRDPTQYCLPTFWRLDGGC